MGSDDSNKKPADAQPSGEAPLQDSDFPPENLNASQQEATGSASKPPRKVAKTMIDVTVGADQVQAAPDADKDETTPPPTQTTPPQSRGRKIAKTLIEQSTPAIESLISEISDSDQPAEVPEKEEGSRKVARTMLEHSLPENVQQQATVTEQPLPTGEDENPKVAKTLLEMDVPSVSDSDENPKIAKTLLEMDLPSVADENPKIAKTLLEMPIPSIEKESPRVAKTLLEISVPPSEVEDPTVAPASEPESMPQTDQRSANSAKPLREVSERDEPFTKTLAEQDLPSWIDQLTEGEHVPSTPSMSESTGQHVETTNSIDQLALREHVQSTDSIDQLALREHVQSTDSIDRLNFDEPQSTDHLTLREHVQSADSIEKLTFDDSVQSTYSIDQVTDHDQGPTADSSGRKSISSLLLRRTRISSQSLAKTLHEFSIKNLEDPLCKSLNVSADLAIPASVSGVKGRPTRQYHIVARTLLDHQALYKEVSKSAQKVEQKAVELAIVQAKEPVIEPIKGDKMASPCAWTWGDDNSKDKFRYCEQCQAHIYNLAGMNRQEVDAIILVRQNIKKYTLYERADGKFMTVDCPVQLKRKKQLMLIIFGTVLLVVTLVASMVLMPPAPPPPKPVATGKTNSTGTATSTDKGNLQQVQVRSDGSFRYEAGKNLPPPPHLQVPRPVKTQTQSAPDPDENGQFWQYTNGQNADVDSPSSNQSR